MTIVAFGKLFSWEDSLFYPGHDVDEDESYVRILGHRLPGLRYRAPTTKAEADFSLCSGVYLLHSSDTEIVYVGQAKQLASRLIAHTGDHLRNRWTHYSWFATSAGLEISASQGANTRQPETEDAASSEETLSLDTLEAILRTALEPRLNLQSGRWRETPLFAQSVEYDFVYLREIFEQNEKLKKKLAKLARNIS